SAPEERLGPEPVVAGPMLADQVVDLPDGFQAGQDEHPPSASYLGADRIADAHQRVVRHRGPDEEPPDQPEEEQELHPVPEGHGFPGLPVLVPGTPARRGQSLRWAYKGLTH